MINSPFVRGFALALSEVVHYTHDYDTVRRVMREAGITVDDLVNADVADLDVQRIKLAYDDASLR